jgi:phosphatidylinositol N-acetylglucosaminyltransferase subunit P
MPPQSRGSGSPHAFSDPRTAPPTLAPFLDNLPLPLPLSSPSSTISDQRTPTANRYGDRPIPSSPTSERLRRTTITNLNHQEEDDHDDGSDYDANLDDADFQSHYSISAENSDPDSDSPISDAGEGIAHTTSPSTSPPATGLLHHSTSAHSLPAPPPLPLFPPFYNRPPTPLPPSPSLTSLLRPPSLLNRSTTSTRPTTPDSSDVETPNDTEAAVAQSARRATVVSRVSPKVPTYEYYGFVLYLASSLAFLLYLLWSYLPSPFLAAIGLHYYPNRWWSLAIPSFLVMLIIYIYAALLSYNVEYLTLPMESVECIVDEAANMAVLDGKSRLRKGGSKVAVRGSNRGAVSGSWGRIGGLMMTTPSGNNGQRRRGGGGGGSEKIQWRNLWNEGTDAVMDIPIGGVCQVLYGDTRDADIS